MKFEYSVIHNGVFYKAGEEVPVENTGASLDCDNDDSKQEDSQSQELTEKEKFEKEIKDVKYMNKEKLLAKAKELEIVVPENTKNEDIKTLIIGKLSN